MMELIPKECSFQAEKRLEDAPFIARFVLNTAKLWSRGEETLSTF